MVASICPGESLRRSTLIRRVGFSLARAISRARSSVFGVAPSRSAGSAAADPLAIEVGRAVDRDLAQPRLDHRDPHRARRHLLLGQEGPDGAEAGAGVGELQRLDCRLQIGERARVAEVRRQHGIDLHRVEQGVALDAEALHLERRRRRRGLRVCGGRERQRQHGRQGRAARQASQADPGPPRAGLRGESAAAHRPE